MPDYHRLTFSVPAERQDELAAELWARGSVGIELREDGRATIVDAYFAEAPGAGLTEFAPRLRGLEVSLLESASVPDTDWLAAHRAQAHPFEVGRRWVVDPGEPVGRVSVVEGRQLLRVPARRAFGTGSHESSRLILEWLEDLELQGRRVLDLGTGSGILSLAAEHLGAAFVLGIDIDPVAVWVAHDNRELNDVAVRLVAGDLACLRPRSFDVALVNILPSEWLSGVGALAAVLQAGASIVLSGIPVDQSADVVGAVERHGFAVAEERRQGDWVAYLATAEGAG